MAVTELALFHHKSSSQTFPAESEAKSGLENLKTAAQEQATFSKHPVALLRCYEDPSLIYLIGGWDSINQHMNEWIPGPINRQLLELLQHDFDVKWMFHSDANPSAVVGRVVKGMNEREASRMLAIERYFVKSEHHDQFAGIWKENMLALEDRSGENDQLVCEGGMRIDHGFEAGEDANQAMNRGVDEFVLFTAWDNVQQHIDSDKLESVRVYDRLRQYLNATKTQHGEVFHLASP